jgi:signal recognition particle subunit SRP54
MLETLTTGFKNARERLAGARQLTDDNVAEALRDVRMSLLEADVDFEVVKSFLARVKERSLGEKVKTRVRDASGRVHRVTAGQHFISICEQELAELMGPVDPELPSKDGCVSIMLAGLQGVGKTTVAGKLAKHLTAQGKKTLLVAADTYRPAAVDQLQTLGARIDVPVHIGEAGQAPPAICAAARARLRAEGFGAVIYDTAGRLAVDESLMAELEEIHRETDPAHTLLVCDALMGRDAVNVAKAFHEQLPLDGLILTKLDGDARGGAALAIKAVTGVPIKFLGTGEALDRLEAFRPEGLASRILGMGDVVGLVQDFEAVVDADQAEKDAERLLSGRFGMDDLLSQLRVIQKMGPLRDVLGKLPMFGDMAEKVDPQELVRVESMIQSMTPRERKLPEEIDASRTRRIARGSGRSEKDVTGLIERFGQMRDLMGQLGSGKGPFGKMGLGGLAGAGAGGPGNPNMLGGFGGAAAPRVDNKRRQAQKRKRKQARKDRKKRRKR